MALGQLEKRGENRRWTGTSEEPVSRGIAILVIAACSLLGWGLLFSIGASLLRFGGYR
jgi:hypothetical protein